MIGLRVAAIARTCKYTQVSNLCLNGGTARSFFLLNQRFQSFSSDAKDPDHNAKDHQRIQSMGSQAEIEWTKPKRGVDYVFNDSGYDTPDVFREHRHQYSKKPTDIAAYRRQITFRCGNIGTKELEIVLRDYLTIYSAKMSYEDLE